MLIKDKATDILIIIIGAFLLAAGINVFLLPNEIAAGGVSGLATVLFYTLKVPLSVTVIAVNLVLFAFGWKILTKWELVKSVIGVFLFSLFLEIAAFLPSYRDDIFIASVIGGVVCGTGTGIIVWRGASTGGSDMLALMMVRRVRTLSIAAVIMITDGIVILLSGFAFSSITIMFYAAITAYVMAKVTDSITVFGDNSKQIQIISEKSTEIANGIMERINRGTTGFYSRGMYTGKDGLTIFCIVNRREVSRVLKLVKETDPLAFVTIEEVREVLGEGFKRIEG